MFGWLLKLNQLKLKLIFHEKFEALFHAKEL